VRRAACLDQRMTDRARACHHVGVARNGPTVDVEQRPDQSPEIGRGNRAPCTAKAFVSSQDADGWPTRQARALSSLGMQ